jgi:hypothetical protein
VHCYRGEEEERRYTTTWDRVFEQDNVWDDVTAHCEQLFKSFVLLRGLFEDRDGNWSLKDWFERRWKYLGGFLNHRGLTKAKKEFGRGVFSMRTVRQRTLVFSK